MASGKGRTRDDGAEDADAPFGLVEPQLFDGGDAEGVGALAEGAQDGGEADAEFAGEVEAEEFAPAFDAEAPLFGAEFRGGGEHPEIGEVLVEEVGDGFGVEGVLHQAAAQDVFDSHRGGSGEGALKGGAFQTARCIQTADAGTSAGTAR